MLLKEICLSLVSTLTIFVGISTADFKSKPAIRTVCHGTYCERIKVESEKYTDFRKAVSGGVRGILVVGELVKTIELEQFDGYCHVEKLTGCEPGTYLCTYNAKTKEPVMQKLLK